LSPPVEPSEEFAPPLTVVDPMGTQVDVEEILDSDCSGPATYSYYVVYENTLGTWYGTPAQSVCTFPGGAGGEPGTVRLDYELGTLTGAPDVWIVVTAANEAGESSAGRDSAGVERDTAPGWPPSIACP
jgi:hypothetical protein